MNSRTVRAWTRYAIAVALVIVVLSPALWLVLMSLRPTSDIMATTLAFRPTLHNYAEAGPANSRPRSGTACRRA